MTTKKLDGGGSYVVGKNGKPKRTAHTIQPDDAKHPTQIARAKSAQPSTETTETQEEGE